MMSEEEMQDLLEIGCCIYHDRLCEKAYNYILEMQNKIDRAISYIYILKNNVKDFKTEYKEDMLNMLDEIGNILGGTNE